MSPPCPRSGTADPSAQRGARVLLLPEGLVVVVPAQDLDLLEQVEVREVVEQFFDEGAIDLGIEGIAGEVVL